MTGDRSEQDGMRFMKEVLDRSTKDNRACKEALGVIALAIDGKPMAVAVAALCFHLHKVLKQIPEDRQPEALRGITRLIEMKSP